MKKFYYFSQNFIKKIVNNLIFSFPDKKFFPIVFISPYISIILFHIIKMDTNQFIIQIKIFIPHCTFVPLGNRKKIVTLYKVTILVLDNP